MKFVVPTLAIIGVISIALSLVFSIELLIKNTSTGQLSSQNMVVTSTIGNSSFITNQQTTYASGTKPDGFKGPDASDTPHAIGPSTPPPSY